MMLTYHPAFDSYHCFLRILTFLTKAEREDFEIDSVRIYDYYLCAPSALTTFKFPKDYMKERKVFSNKVNQYNDVPNQRALFYDLKNIQDAAFDKMVSMGLIDYDNFRSGKVTLVKGSFPKGLTSALESVNSIDADVVYFVLNILTEIPLLGLNGLKHRSGLMEHRYDLV